MNTEVEVRSAFIVAAIKDRILEKQQREYGYPLESLEILFRLRFNADIAVDLDSMLQRGEVLIVSRRRNVSETIVSFSVAEARELQRERRARKINVPRVYLWTNLPKNWRDDRFTMRERLSRILKTIEATSS